MKASEPMLCVDVNILVYAHRPESPNHGRYWAWLDETRRGVEPLAVPGIVLSGFLRLVTHPRIFKEPTPLPVALEFIEAVKGSPSVVPIENGARHWQIFTDLCRQVGAKGNQVPDIYLAAMAIEHGATWVSADRGFAGIPGLRWYDPTRG